jgi:hypothetical protein
MLDSLLAGMILFSSFSMRTANVQPNPVDYEVSMGLESTNYYINRQWERELGEDYVDTQFWLMYDNNGLYFKPEYFDKQSKGIKYLKIDSRSIFKGFSFGITMRNEDESLKTFENFFSGGYKISKKHDKTKIEFSVDGYYVEGLDYETKFNISWSLTDKISLYSVGELYDVKDQQFYKTKIGIAVKL